MFVHNSTTDPIDPGELLLPIALALAMTAVLWTILGLLLRSATRAAMVVSLFLMLFFSYGHIAGAFGPFSPAWTDLLVFWVLLMVAGTWLAARRSRPAARGSRSGTTVLLNSVAAAIVIVNLATGMQAFMHRPPRNESVPTRDAAAMGKDYPDIYYIITDSYARSDVLKSHYQTDNTGFLNDLSQMGFFVADRARSNYVQTYLSLASSLNFTYLDSLAAALGPESDDHGPLIRMIQNNRLLRFLRRRGYTIVSFASGYTGTDLAGADVHFAPRWSLSEFQSIMVNTTMLRDVLYMLHRSPVDLHRDRVLYTLRNLPNAGLGRHPVFVFAHILSPHPPFVFDARGERPGVPASFTSDQAQAWLTQMILTKGPGLYDKYYGPQVLYLNTLLEAAVRRILAQSPRPPIIVIQGDHGPGSVPDWDRLTHNQVLEQPAIFDAVYLPPSGERPQPSVELYDSISPVNTFRIVLSRFFDTTLALLPDRSYFSILSRPYQFYDADRPESYPVIGGTGKKEQ
ncbi:MAG: hypothetical protein NTX53_21610 [candidate division WOR-3 bacterium]|nr:hypothetical protein [candidate division WOR-3 bacterium]